MVKGAFHHCALMVAMTAATAVALFIIAIGSPASADAKQTGKSGGEANSAFVPVYDVSTLLSSEIPAKAIFRYAAQDTQNPARLMVTAGTSAVYEVDLTAKKVALYAGMPGVSNHSDGDRLREAIFHKPHGICVDKLGYVFVADTGSATVRVIQPSTGSVTTVAGSPYGVGHEDGTGQQAKFSAPAGLLCLNSQDGSTSLLVGDLSQPALRQLHCRVSTGTHTGTADMVCDVTTIANTTQGEGHGYFAHLATDNQRVLAGDGHAAIWEVQLYEQQKAQDPKLFGGNPDEPEHKDADSALDARFLHPMGLCVNPRTGSVLVADAGSSTIRHISAKTGGVSTIAGQPGIKGSADGTGAAAQFITPASIICLPDGSAIVGDSSAHSLRQLRCVQNCDESGQPDPGDDDHDAKGGFQPSKAAIIMLAIGAAGLAYGALGNASRGLAAAVSQRIQDMRARHTGSGYMQPNQDASQAPLLGEEVEGNLLYIEEGPQTIGSNLLGPEASASETVDPFAGQQAAPDDLGQHAHVQPNATTTSAAADGTGKNT